jgi:hypothetical protein
VCNKSSTIYIVIKTQPQEETITHVEMVIR